MNPNSMVATSNPTLSTYNATAEASDFCPLFYKMRQVNLPSYFGSSFSSSDGT